jgi:hypothetical protein
MSILGFPILVSALLQLIAIFHPNVPSDKIVDLIKHYWPTGALRQTDIDKRQNAADQVQVDINKDQRAVTADAATEAKEEKK